MTTTSKIIIPLAILLIGLAGMFALLSLKEDSPKHKLERRPKLLRTATADLRPTPAKIVAYGRVTSAQPVQLISEVAGTIQRGDVPFQPAQRFSRGDLIVKIDDRQAGLNLNSRTSELLNALASVLPEIKVDFPGRYPKWQAYFDSIAFDEALPPLPETENQRVKLLLSRFNVYTLYFAVKDLEIRLEKHYFYAPFDGAIVSANLREGATARNGTNLGEIINLEDLEVEVPVAVEDVGWIDHDRPVEFSSEELAGLWTGEVVRMGSDIDTRTQTVPVYISIDAGQKLPLLSGVFLRAEIPGQKIDMALTLPNGAIYDEQYVYLISGGKLQPQDVSIARRQLDSVIIDGGLQQGDTVVVEPLQGVVAGMPAKPLSATEKERSM